MSMRILLNDIFGKDHFDNVIEYKLLLYIANLCKHFDKVLDISKMRPWFDLEQLKETYSIKMCQGWMRTLIHEGCLYVGIDPEKVPKGEPLTVNLDSFFKEDRPLFEEREGSLYWCYDTPRTLDYVEKEKFLVRGAENYILALTGLYLLKRYLGLEKSPSLIIDFRMGTSKYNSLAYVNTYLYINILSCIKTIPTYGKYIELRLSQDVYEKDDLDYLLFMKNARYDGKLQDYTVKEKLEKLSLLNYDIGGIYIIWKRRKINANNPSGLIDNAIVVRLDEIGDDFIGVLRIPVSATYEEKELDYFEIKNEVKNKYIDLLQRKPLITTVEKIPIYNLGIEGYLNKEEYFITKIDTSERLDCIFFYDGRLHKINTTAVEVIYWIMCQGEVEFDQIKYRDEYNEGKELLWDIYGYEQENLEGTYRDAQLKLHGDTIIVGS